MCFFSVLAYVVTCRICLKVKTRKGNGEFGQRMNHLNIVILQPSFGQHGKSTKKCDFVPSEIKKACVKTLKRMEVGKIKKKALAHKIGRTADPQDEISQELQRNTQTLPFGPFDQFVTVEARQTTIGNKYKEHREVDWKMHLCL